MRARLTVLISLNFFTSISSSEKKNITFILKNVQSRIHSYMYFAEEENINQCLKQVRDLSTLILWSKKFNLMGRPLIENKQFLLATEEKYSW